jgi:hypothetical protein
VSEGLEEHLTLNKKPPVISTGGFVFLNNIAGKEYVSLSLIYIVTIFIPVNHFL